MKHWLEREITQWVNNRGSIRWPTALQSNALRLFNEWNLTCCRSDQLFHMLVFLKLWRSFKLRLHRGLNWRSLELMADTKKFLISTEIFRNNRIRYTLFECFGRNPVKIACTWKCQEKVLSTIHAISTEIFRNNRIHYTLFECFGRNPVKIACTRKFQEKVLSTIHVISTEIFRNNRIHYTLFECFGGNPVKIAWTWKHQEKPLSTIHVISTEIFRNNRIC